MLRIEEQEVARMVASGRRPRVPQAGEVLRLETAPAPILSGPVAVAPVEVPATAEPEPALELALVSTESEPAVGSGSNPDPIGTNGFELGKAERQRLEELKRRAND
jgi:hypothetical protein